MTCGNTSDVKEEIDTEFQELLAQTSDKTTIDECVDFDFETVTSEPAVNTQNEDLGQVLVKEVLQKSFTWTILHHQSMNQRVVLVLRLTGQFLFIFFFIKDILNLKNTSKSI